MMLRDYRESIRRHATLEEENPWVVLVLGNIAATAAMAAIVWELGPIKDMKGLVKAEHIALVAATILSAWTFIHVMFALHYAGEYYSRPRHHDGAAPSRRPRIHRRRRSRLDRFPLSGVRDRMLLRDLRRQHQYDRRCAPPILVHSVVSFFFNTIILALTINIGAGFF